MQSVEAYPLHWPPHRKRTESGRRRRATFHRRIEQTGNYPSGQSYTWSKKERLTIADSRDRLISELAKFGAKGTVISSNLRLRNDGLPISAQRQPEDPGIAVYFQLNGNQHCLSCDLWDKSADNLAAIAKHVEAMRGQVRWGVADVAAMFAGFKALPGAIITPTRMSEEDAASLLSVWSGVNRLAIESIAERRLEAYRIAVKKLHPDANDGTVFDADNWKKLQEAKEVLGIR